MELLDRVYDSEPAARDVLLEQLASQQHPLLTALRKILEAGERARASEFLADVPRLIPAQSTAPVWEGGQTVGPYRLERLLGQGGMSEVWLADRFDGLIDRQAALKLPYQQTLRHRRDAFVARFEREKAIVAMLRHPNIANLDEAGVTPEGQPWMALEYVDGESIADWCDNERATVRRRIEIFVDVLHAVEYAHASLVIHRDLKPANILVRRNGSPCLLDFGIAKLLGPESDVLVDTDLTRDIGRPLTLAYASPEQALGRPLTTASDIYSLGVVLYELMCGHGPYELQAASMLQLQEAIVGKDPASPSRRLDAAAAQARGGTLHNVAREIGGDIDAIVAKSLQKEPERRYASAATFRLDLMRWLAGETVLARAPSRVYVLRKFISRHYWGVGLSALAIVALAATSVTAVVFELRAASEARNVRMSKDTLREIFRQADPDLSHGPNMSARDMLAESRKRVEKSFAGQAALQADLLGSIGELQGTVGDDVAATETLAKVIQLYDDGRHPREVVMARIAYAYELFHLGDYDKASTVIELARQGGAAFASDDELQTNLTAVRGQIAWQHKEYEPAERLLADALRRSTTLHGPNDSRTLDILSDLTSVEAARGSIGAAQDHVAELVARTRQSTSIAPGAVQRVELQSARIQMLAGQYERARTGLAVAVPRCQAALGDVNEWCLLLAMRQAELLIRVGRNEMALSLVPAFEASVASALAPRRQAESLVTVCRVLAANGRLPPDGDLMRRLQALGRSGAGVALSQDVKTKALLAEAEADLRARRPDEALRVLELSLQRMANDETLAADAGLHVRQDLLTGLALRQQGDGDGALAAIQRSVEGARHAFGPDDVLTRLVELDLATTLQGVGRTRESAALSAAATKALAERFGNDCPVLEIARTIGAPSPRAAAVESPPFFI